MLVVIKENNNNDKDNISDSNSNMKLYKDIKYSNTRNNT